MLSASIRLIFEQSPITGYHCDYYCSCSCYFAIAFGNVFPFHRFVTHFKILLFSYTYFVFNQWSFMQRIFIGTDNANSLLRCLCAICCVAVFILHSDFDSFACFLLPHFFFYLLCNAWFGFFNAYNFFAKLFYFTLNFFTYFDFIDFAD